MCPCRQTHTTHVRSRPITTSIAFEACGHQEMSGFGRTAETRRVSRGGRFDRAEDAENAHRPVCGEMNSDETRPGTNPRVARTRMKRTDSAGCSVRPQASDDAFRPAITSRRVRPWKAVPAPYCRTLRPVSPQNSCSGKIVDSVPSLEIGRLHSLEEGMTRERPGNAAGPGRNSPWRG